MIEAHAGENVDVFGDRDLVLHIAGGDVEIGVAPLPAVAIDHGQIKRRTEEGRIHRCGAAVAVDDADSVSGVPKQERLRSLADL